VFISNAATCGTALKPAVKRYGLAIIAMVKNNPAANFVRTAFMAAQCRTIFYQTATIAANKKSR